MQINPADADLNVRCLELRVVPTRIPPPYKGKENNDPAIWQANIILINRAVVLAHIILSRMVFGRANSAFIT